MEAGSQETKPEVIMSAISTGMWRGDVGGCEWQCVENWKEQSNDREYPKAWSHRCV